MDNDLNIVLSVSNASTLSRQTLELGVWMTVHVVFYTSCNRGDFATKMYAIKPNVLESVP